MSGVFSVTNQAGQTVCIHEGRKGNVDPIASERIRELIQRDDPAALEAIYDQWGDGLWKCLLAVTGSASRAEEAMQNLFVSIARKRQRVAEARDIPAYLFAMARNHGRDVADAESRRQTREESLEAWQNTLAVADRPAADDDAEEAAEVARAVASLPAAQREVVWKKCFEGLTFAEVAEVLNISPNTAASRYRLALEKLRSILAGRLCRE